MWKWLKDALDNQPKATTICSLDYVDDLNKKWTLLESRVRKLESAQLASKNELRPINPYITGIPGRKKRTEITPEMTAAVKLDDKNGWTTKQIATKYALSPASVRRIILGQTRFN